MYRSLLVVASVCLTALACSTSPNQAPVDASVGLSDASSLDAADAASDALDARPPLPPAKLSATGLFADIDAGTLAADIEEYEPRYALWADDATKARWVRMPAGAKVDTSNMDHWSLPVGTRFWKEFRVSGVRVETRMIERWGPGVADYFYAPYQWNSAQTDADYTPGGAVNANGTAHDIPPLGACNGCHVGLREHVLGFSAIQLSQSSGNVTLESLSAQGRVTVAPSGVYDVPGNGMERAALGYLHGNCGNCHNADDGVNFVTPFSLRVLVGDTTVQQAGVYKTSVNVPTDGFMHPGITLRIARGDAGASAVSFRMSVRGIPNQMPPLATKLADDAGVTAVNAWISALPP